MNKSSTEYNSVKLSNRTITCYVASPLNGLIDIITVRHKFLTENFDESGIQGWEKVV